jgi:hypothetical protein
LCEWPRPSRHRKASPPPRLIVVTNAGFGRVGSAGCRRRRQEELRETGAAAGWSAACQGQSAGEEQQAGTVQGDERVELEIPDPERSAAG